MPLKRPRLRAGVLSPVLLLVAACGGPADEIIVLYSANSYGYFDDCGCRADSTGGLAKRAWVIDSLRRTTDTPIFLVDAGDFTGGENAYGAALGRVMVDAMEIMEYDAFTLGEWDLNQGTAYVHEIVTGSPIAWVHTNYEIAGLEELGQKTLVVERGDRRIGFLGLYNPTILLNPTMRDSVIVEPDIVASAQRGVVALREQNVDAIVVLSHLSYKGDLALAKYVSGIDLIVSGHGGKTLPSAEQAAPDTWVVAAGDLGRYVGRAEIEFGGGVESGVQAVTGDLVVMVPSLPNDPRLDPLFANYEQERKQLMRKELDARRGPAGAEPIGDLEAEGLRPPQS